MLRGTPADDLSDGGVRGGALYDAFPASEARRILQRPEFHHTLKHAGWLNMVEIEIGVLRGQCLDRRIDNKDYILSEIAAWQQRRGLPP